MKDIALLISLIILLSCGHRQECPNLDSGFYDYLKATSTNKDTLHFLSKLDKVIKNSPNCLLSLQVRGSLLIDLNAVQRGKADLLKTIRIDSNSIYSLFKLAVLYSSQSNNDSALFYINKAYRLKTAGGFVFRQNKIFENKFDIEYEDMIFLRGVIYYDMRAYRFSKHEFLRYLELRPSDGDTYDYLSSIYYMLNKKDSACFYINAIRDMGYKPTLDTVICR